MKTQSKLPGSISKTFLGIFFILIIIIALVTVYFYLRKAPDMNNSVTEISSGEFSAEVKKLGSAEILSGFPEDLPMQDGSEVLDNYEATSNDGRIQSTKLFKSPQTTAQALQTYTNFFTGKGWVRNVGGSLTSPILMRRADDTLMISVSSGIDSSEAIVEITLTQNQY